MPNCQLRPQSLAHQPAARAASRGLRPRFRRETGDEVVQVHCSEGVAIRTGTSSFRTVSLIFAPRRTTPSGSKLAVRHTKTRITPRSLARARRLRRPPAVHYDPARVDHLPDGRKSRVSGDGGLSGSRSRTRRHISGRSRPYGPRPNSRVTRGHRWPVGPPCRTRSGHRDSRAPNLEHYHEVLLVSERLLGIGRTPIPTDPLGGAGREARAVLSILTDQIELLTGARPGLETIRRRRGSRWTITCS